jgi:hypothetical protein
VAKAILALLAQALEDLCAHLREEGKTVEQSKAADISVRSQDQVSPNLLLSSLFLFLFSPLLFSSSSTLLLLSSSTLLLLSSSTLLLLSSSSTLLLLLLASLLL